MAGAGRLQVAVHALLPSVTPQMVGLLLYRFDVDVRSSLPARFGLCDSRRPAAAPAQLGRRGRAQVGRARGPRPA